MKVAARVQVRGRSNAGVKKAPSRGSESLGDRESDAALDARRLYGDVLFTERPSSSSSRRQLGLLGDLARGKVLFEIFRKAPTELEFLCCVAKLIDLTLGEARSGRRGRTRGSAVDRPSLCVITPSLPGAFAARVGATRESVETPGVYTLPALLRTTVVVVDELAKDPSTVWLRLLGRGSVQAEALRELASMRGQKRLRDETIKLLTAWRRSLPQGAELSEQDREMSRNLEGLNTR